METGIALLLIGLIMVGFIGLKVMDDLSAIRKIDEWMKADILMVRAHAAEWQEKERQKWEAAQRALNEEHVNRVMGLARQVIEEEGQVVGDAVAGALDQIKGESE